MQKVKNCKLAKNAIDHCIVTEKVIHVPIQTGNMESFVLQRKQFTNSAANVRTAEKYIQKMQVSIVFFLVKVNAALMIPVNMLKAITINSITPKQLNIKMMEHYKGIMLCNRPQASINLDYHKPFVSRVTHAEPLGYNPVKQLQIHQPTKQIKPILKQHKEWLQSFQKHAKEKKTALHYSQVSSRLNPDRYRSNSDKLKDSLELPNVQETQQLEQPKEEVENMNKDEEMEVVDDQELQELLNFSKNLDYDQYINDLEVRTVVEALKKRIEEIRVENPHLSQKEVTKKALKSNTQQKQTVKHVTIQEQKEDQKEIDFESVVKKIADEILAKNKYLRNIHSNQSMQKLVETEARRFLQKG